MKKIIILFFSVKLLLGVTLVPLYQTVDDKKSARMTYTITNPSQEPIAVDFSIFQVIDTFGKKEKRIKSSAIVAHPTQLVLKSGESKTVRVRYMNKHLPEVEEVYRVIAKELDIDMSDQVKEAPKGKIQAELKMRYSYEGLLFVKQPQAQPKLDITSFNELPASTKNHRNIEVVITNSGTASALPNIKQYDYIFTIGKQEYTLVLDDIKETYFKRILPGKSYTLTLRNISSLPKGKIETVRLQLKTHSNS